MYTRKNISGRNKYKIHNCFIFLDTCTCDIAYKSAFCLRKPKYDFNFNDDKVSKQFHK